MTFSLAKCQSRYFSVSIIARTPKICHGTERQKLGEQRISPKATKFNTFEVTSHLLIGKIAM